MLKGMSCMRRIWFLFLFMLSGVLNAEVSFNQEQQHYVLSEPVSAIELFRSLTLNSGIHVDYEEVLAGNQLLLPTEMTENQIIRWLDQEYSTIKKKADDGAVLALTILPKGRYQSEYLVAAVSDDIQGYQHRKGATPPQAARTFERRIREMDRQLQQALQQRIDVLARKDKERLEKRQQKSQYRQQKKQELIEELAYFKQSDPRIYQRLIEVNRYRYPDIEKQVP